MVATREELAEKLKTLERLKKEAKALTGNKGGRPKKSLEEIAAAASSKDNAYRDKLEKNAARARAKGEVARNIGRIPEPKDQARRDACKFDLVRWMLTYQAGIYALPFCQDQKHAIAKVQRVVLEGDTNALGMPRGQGKTSISRSAALWGEIYGHRHYTCIVGATQGRAEQSLLSIKRQIQNNLLLGEDFPEVCYPISRLERVTIRANAQIYTKANGTNGFTDLTWGTDELVLPVIEGAASSGGIITCCGITGDILGQLYPVGEISIRPDLVIVDDVQTFESAHSLHQVETLERIINADILGLGGPGKKIAVVMPMTVKCKGDLADRFLSPKIHPGWNGTRTKMVYSWPVAKDLWDQYRNIRCTFDPDKEDDHKRAKDEATLFYLERAEDGWGGNPANIGMNTGFEVAWPERYDADEVSAQQNAMNIRIDRGEEAFFSEFQNDPLSAVADDTMVQPEVIAKKVNGIPQGIVSEQASVLTCFIDVQASVLYYAVVAWRMDFTGWIVDYGTWPDQRRTYFRLREADQTMALVTGIHGEEAQIRAGLLALTGQLLGREWFKQGGTPLKISKCLVDAGYQTDTVYEVCRASPHAAVLTPSHGKGIRASDTPMAVWKKQSGTVSGPLPFWVEQSSVKRSLVHVVHDVGFFKSFVHARLAVATGNPGALSLFGDDVFADRGGHRMFADHLTSEYPTIEEVDKRRVAYWQKKPGAENHWFDCIVGCTAAASRIGVTLAGIHAGAKPPQPTMSMREMKERARSGR